MENIVTYIREYGEYTFTEEPLNEVDSLVLCQLSYLNYSSFVPGLDKRNAPVSIQSIYHHPDRDVILDDYWYRENNRELFAAAAQSRRFGSLKMNFQEMLGEDSDGQMSLVMDDKSMIEHQITGQITIEEVLEEWEKTKRAAEAALEDAKQRKLESAKARALQEAGTIMDRLTGVLPKLDAGMTPRELLEEEYMQEDSEAGVPAEKVHAAPEMRQITREAEVSGETNGAALEAGDSEEPDIPEEPEILEEMDSSVASEEEELWPEGMSLEEMVAAQQARAKETAETEKESNDIDEDRGAVEMETETITETVPEAETQPEKKKGFEELPMDELPERPTLEQEREEEFAFVRKKSSRPSWKEKTTRMPQFDTPVDLGREEKVELTDEQKARKNIIG